MNIGNKIKFLRKKNKLTQKQLAQVLDTSASTIGMYEQNRREPDIDTIIKMCIKFRVSPDYLLEKEERFVIPRLSRVGHCRQFNGDFCGRDRYFF